MHAHVADVHRLSFQHLIKMDLGMYKLGMSCMKGVLCRGSSFKPIFVGGVVSGRCTAIKVEVCTRIYLHIRGIVR